MSGLFLWATGCIPIEEPEIVWNVLQNREARNRGIYLPFPISIWLMAAPRGITFLTLSCCPSGGLCTHLQPEKSPWEVPQVLVVALL